jgi:hypothetical protein
VTAYHCYLTEEEFKHNSDYNDLVHLNENKCKVIAKELSKRIMYTDYQFLYNHDDSEHAKAANKLRRKFFKKNYTVCINDVCSYN